LNNRFLHRWQKRLWPPRPSRPRQLSQRSNRGRKASAISSKTVRLVKIVPRKATSRAKIVHKAAEIEVLVQRADRPIVVTAVPIGVLVPVVTGVEIVAETVRALKSPRSS